MEIRQTRGEKPYTSNLRPVVYKASDLINHCAQQRLRCHVFDGTVRVNELLKMYGIAVLKRNKSVRHSKNVKRYWAQQYPLQSR